MNVENINIENMKINKPKTTLREKPTSMKPDSLDKPELANDKRENRNHKDIPLMVDSSPSREASEFEEKNFADRLTDLKKAMAEMEEHGEEISEKMFENIMDMKFSDFEALVNSGEIIKQKDLRSFHDKVSDILNKNYDVITKKSEYEGSKFRKLVNTTGFKALIGAAIFFGKFNPLAANEHKAIVKDKVIPSTEQVSVKPDLGGGDPGTKTINAKDTFKFSPDAAVANELRDAAKIDITQLFKIDKAEISTDEAKDIKNEIDSFLDKINSHNFEKFEQARKVADVSSSAEATKYGAADKNLPPTLENNKTLTGDRFTKGAGIAEDAFKNHNYKNSDLSPKQIEIAKNTKIELKAPEKGYTAITDLYKIDPKTGKEMGEKYSDKEVEEMKKENPDLYKKLNEECRHFKLDLMVESALQQINQCDRFTFFVDNSNSTEYTFAKTADKLEKIGLQENSKGDITKVDLVYYSDNINSVKHLSNILKVADDLRGTHIKGGSLEKPFKVAIEYYKDLAKKDAERIKNGEKIEDNRGAAWTIDEGLQGAQDIFEAAELAKKANVKNATILLFSRDRAEPLEKDLFEVADQIKKIVEAEVKSNLSVLEQNKLSQEKSLINIISDVNVKVSPETLNKIFGQDKLGDSAEAIKTLIDGDSHKVNLEKVSKSGAEKYVLLLLFKSIKDFTKASKLSDNAKTKTFENHLETTQIEVKVFTDEKGNKVTFDVLGYKKLLPGEKLESLKL